MNLYLISFDLKPGVGDMAFVEHLERFLGKLRAAEGIAGWRLIRRKLGLGPPAWGEFLLSIETESLAQLDHAFSMASRRDEPMESLHFEVNRWTCNLSFALYRDFPDAHRQRGEEKF